MTRSDTNNWNMANQQYLMAAIRVIQAELETYQAVQHSNQNKEIINRLGVKEAEMLLDEARAILPTPSALETVVAVLRLSSFERKILLTCAGVELSADFASLVSGMQGNTSQALPSFSLAMAVFGDAHWSAVSPNNPLRYWRLIELLDHPLLTRSSIRIDEQLLHFLTGIHSLDERFSEWVQQVMPQRFLVASHLDLSEQVCNSCTVAMADSLPPPVIRLNGDDSDKAGIAEHASGRLGKRLFGISAYSVPVAKSELTELIRIWNREAAINGYALFLDCSDMDSGDKSRSIQLQHFVENIQGLLFISTDRWSPKINRYQIVLDMVKPTRTEQNGLWQSTLELGNIFLNGQLEKLVSQFDLSAKTIQQVSAEIISNHLASPGTGEDPENVLKKDLWKRCCKHSRPQVDDLAQRINPVSVWDNLVLPEAQKDILREVAMQVKQRKKVYDDWGFAGTSSRGLGISAMFTGESGTGKTMAAEVLANELQLDLYRIDLSQVVNKYIGETEKNLKRIFDAAEEGGAILLFDEADALFGKRSEVKDSHDRYGNIEVSYLLQRMEAYRGLAILTTNMKSSMDKAFLRRIRFVVQFPFPGIVQRAEIWSKVFPLNTPVAALDMDKLAKLSLPGGNIRNIAMNAAFIAAEEQTPVGMSQILRAARSEFNKLDKPMNSIEAGIA